MILTGRSLTGVPSTITVTNSRTEITPIRMKVSRKVLLCLGNSVSLKLTIIHMEIQDNTVDVGAEMARRNEAILEEIRNAGYEGPVVNGMDLDVF